MSDLLVLCQDCILVCCSNLCQAGDRYRACHDKQGYNEDEGDHGHGGKKGEGDHSHGHGGRKGGGGERGSEEDEVPEVAESAQS